MRTVAVVLAGGSGLRLGGELPKQLQLLAGRTLLEHSVAAFEQAPGVDDIIVVMPAAFVGTAASILGDKYGKLRRIIAGGADRPGSTRSAIDLLSKEPPYADPAPADPAPADPALTDPAPADPALADPALTDPALADPALTDPTLADPALTDPALADPALTDPALADPALAGPALAGPECNVLFHDAARPLVDQRIIADCVATLAEHEALGVVVPTADTIVQLADGTMVSIPPRESLGRCQTPQGFRLSVIRLAYELAAIDLAAGAFTATDDCGMVLRYLPEVPVKAVAGSERNLKITYPGDLLIAESLLLSPDS